MGFIRALCHDVRSDFGSKAIIEQYNLGSKSNIARIKESLLNRELIETNADGIYLDDPVFKLWFLQKYPNP